MKTLKTQFYALIFLLSSTIVLSQENYLMILGQEIVKMDSLENKNVIIKNTDIDLDAYRLHKIKNENYLLNYQSGILYQIKEDSIIRFDHSYDDKVHNGSLEFVFKDTLYRFGGYGYYHTNKTLIYFDQNSKEWDLVSFKGYEKIEPFSSIGFYYVENNQLNVLGYDTLENEYQNIPNKKKKGFTLDLTTKEIIDTFELNEKFIFPDYYITTNEFVFLFYRNKREIEIFEIETKSFYSYTLGLDEYGMAEEKNQNHLIINDVLFFIVTDINRKKEIKSIKISRIIDNMIKINKKSNSSKSIFYIQLLLISSLLFTLGLYFRKTQKLKLNENNLIYRSKKIDLSFNEQKVISLLLEKKRCTTNELNEIFHKEGLNTTHINRTKNNSIKELNLRFNQIYKMDLILQKNSSFDKRLKEYYINSNLRF